MACKRGTVQVLSTVFRGGLYRLLAGRDLHVEAALDHPGPNKLAGLAKLITCGMGL